MSPSAMALTSPAAPLLSAALLLLLSRKLLYSACSCVDSSAMCMCFSRLAHVHVCVRACMRVHACMVHACSV